MISGLGWHNIGLEKGRKESENKFINKILSVVVGGNPLPLGSGRKPLKFIAINLDFQCTFV